MTHPSSIGQLSTDPVQPMHDLAAPDSAEALDRAVESERLRNLEILKYGSSLRINYNDDKFIAADPSAPRLAGDALLTGLCQLLALRVGCLNCFVCLNDVERQHIIAEATQSVSPYDGTVHAPHDGLLFGVQSFDHAFGITQLTLPAYTRGQNHFVSNQNTSINDERAIFLDLKNEPLTDRVPFLQAESGAPYRFYLETPLKNTAGVVVGIVAALDNKPRSAFEEVDIRPILDGAQMVMEHLELVRLRDLNARAERLMQGLSHFNEGQSSISEWIEHGPTPALPSDLARGKQRTRGPPSESSLTATTERRSDMTPATMTPSTQPEQYFETTITTPTTDPQPAYFSNADPLLYNAALTANTTDPTIASLLKAASTVAPQPGTEVGSGEPAPAISRTFARAANLICESMDLQGTCFLEVPSDVRSDLAERTEQRKGPSKNVNPGESPPPESSDSDAKQRSSESPSASDSSEKFGTTSCRCIAFAVRNSSSSMTSPSARPQTSITRPILDDLVAMYPTGHIFQFDVSGSLSSEDDSERDITSGVRRSRRRKVAQTLSSNFSGARSLLFVPLYDYEQQKLYSAFFGWTNDNFRVLLNADAVYVAAFANSIMCEVMRLETLALEKAKSVFMSSISHELRSPLHGILAATELLRESRLNTDQTELALMVDSCGRTLLDIMNNLLDHAKINNMIDNSKGTRRNRGRHAPSPSLRSNQARGIETTHDPVNVAEVVEETVVSVASSHASKIQRAEQVSIQTRQVPAMSGDAEDSELHEARTPIVVLNIENSDHWLIHIDKGSWRRVVMNLVGNALKYTISGYVEVGLSVVEAAGSNQQSNEMVFTVLDSGRGISKSYLKNKLYIPFAQEDRLSVGVGLGLSIVNRLVLALGGKIDVESEVNVGTNIKVVIPIPKSPPHETVPPPVISASIAAAQLAAPGGASVCFCGFNVLPALSSTPTGIMSPHAQALLKLKHSLKVMMEKWFGLVEQSASEADICVLEASYANTLLKQDPSDTVFQKKYIVVYAYQSDQTRDLSWPGCSNTITMPVGPVKLARILHATFGQQVQQPTQTAVASNASTSAPGTVTTATPEVASDSAVSRTASPAPPPANSASRILLVDDNDINVRILVGLVRKLGLSYGTACNGQDALDQYIAAHSQGRPYQYIFMDISMPVMDGLTSTKRIRAYEKENDAHMPAQIFALTGLGHSDAQDAAIASGVDQYLRKPVRLNILRSLLPVRP